jgi:hypothetical protein
MFAGVALAHNELLQYCTKRFFFSYLSNILGNYSLIVAIYIDSCYTGQIKGGKGATRRK